MAEEAKERNVRGAIRGKSGGVGEFDKDTTTLDIRYFQPGLKVRQAPAAGSRAV